MKKVKIYQFEVYHVQSDEMLKSRRWGTREAIVETAHGRVLEESAIEVDESAIASDIPGFTARDFNPKARQGFQTSVP